MPIFTARNDHDVDHLAYKTASVRIQRPSQRAVAEAILSRMESRAVLEGSRAGVHVRYGLTYFYATPSRPDGRTSGC